ncbi:MAG: hypothetical protein KDA90_06260 [Planctomycetaceae bacterium]|nr:hypothetical protein [Planctomycetaceae bacterium]
MFHRNWTIAALRSSPRRVAVVGFAVLLILLTSWRLNRLQYASDAETQLQDAGVRLQQSDNALGRLLPPAVSRWLPLRLSTSITHAELPRGTKGPRLLQLCGRLRTLTSLHAAYCGLSDDDLSTLRQLRKLRSLWLDGNELTNAAMPELAALPDLNYLSIDCPRITWSGLEQLGQLSRKPQLIEGTALRRLAGTEGLTVHSYATSWVPYGQFAAPQRLQISTTQGEPLTAMQLSPLRYLTRIQELSVLCSLEPDAYRLMTSLPELNALTLKDQDFNGEALQMIARTCSLNKLAVESPRLDDEDLAQLGTMTTLTSLSLDLRSDLVGRGLVSLRNLTQLRRVELWFRFPSSQDNIALASSDELRSARIQLGQILGGLPDLQRCELSGSGVLLVVPGLTSSRSLRQLSLHTPGIDVETIEALANCPHLTRLDLFVDAPPTELPVLLTQHRALEALHVSCPKAAQLDWSLFRRQHPGCKLTLANPSP